MTYLTCIRYKLLFAVWINGLFGLLEYNEDISAGSAVLSAIC